jgi:hypothetical protein
LIGVARPELKNRRCCRIIERLKPGELNNVAD